MSWLLHPAPRRSRRRPRLLLLSVAAIIGALVAMASAPWRAARADLAAARAAIGGRLAPAPADTPPAWLDPRGRLDAWSSDAATPATDRRAVALALADRGAWGWTSRSPDAMHHWLREMAVASPAPGDAEWRLVLDRLAACAGDAGPDADRTAGAWLAAPLPAPRDRAVRECLFAALASSGRLADPAGDDLFSTADPRSVRLRHLALEGEPAGLEAAVRAAATRAPPPEVLAALLVRLATVAPVRLVDAGDRDVAALIAAAEPDAVAAALALAGDRLGARRADADQRLAALAAAGSVHAQRLRAARPWSAGHRPPPPPDVALGAGDDEAALRAAIAAWRRSEPVTAGLAERLLDDPAVSPALAALLVDRRADPAARPRLATAWIRSLDDRRKQAGAILVALRPHAGTPSGADATATTLRAALAAAHRIEDQPEVRRLQRLALLAAGGDPGAGPTPAMLLSTAPPDRRPAVALLVALAGDRTGLAELTRLPPGADAATIALLDAAIARLVPHWHEAVGRTVGGGAIGPRLHRDRLEARRLVESPGLRFDAAARRFGPPSPATAAAGLPAARRAPMIEP